MLSGIFAYSTFLSCSSSSAILSLNNLWNLPRFSPVSCCQSSWVTTSRIPLSVNIITIDDNCIDPGSSYTGNSGYTIHIGDYSLNLFNACWFWKIIPGGIQSQSEKENELLWTNNNGWWTLLLEVITTTKIAVRETYKVNDITNVCFIPSTWIVKWKISTIVCVQGLAESKTGVGDEDVRNTAVNLVMVSLLEPLFLSSPTVNFVLVLLVKIGWKIRLSRGTLLPKVNNGHYFYYYLGFSLILFLWLCDHPTLNSELIKTNVRFKSLKI